MSARRLIFTVIVLFCASLSFAQTPATYRRFVVDEQSRPLDYFYTIIYNPSDSTYLTGVACFEGKLEIKHTFKGRKLIFISCLGYEDLFYIEDFSAPAAADTLVMKSAIIGLDTVTVTLRAPAISTSRGKTVVRIAGSSLQNLPEVHDILRRIPGVNIDDKDITIFGKGIPQIYIDDRESSYAELQMLQPSQIVSIEVDRNPSARYDASYSSVVRVKTNRASIGKSGQIASHSYFGRRYRNITSAQLQITTNKWTNYFSYMYSDQMLHSYVWDTEAINLPENQIADSIYSDGLYHSRSHSVLWGSALDINTRHQLSWQYSGVFGWKNNRIRQEERIYQLGILQNMNAENITNSNSLSHSASVRYRFSIDSERALSISAFLASSTPKSRETVSRLYIESGENDLISINNVSAAEVFSAKAEYSTPLFGANLLTGLRYGHINSRTTSIYNDNRNVTLLLNDNVSAYVKLGKDHTKWGWSVGVRGEFTNDNVRVSDKQLRNGWENNVFPSLDVYTLELSKALDFSFSYTSRITRPSVSQLNPAARYINSIVVGYGNPMLLSTISHNMELGVTLWSNFSLTLGANYDINASIEAGELSESGDAIVFKPLNVSRSHNYLIDATYNNSWGPFSMTLNGGIVFPRSTIPYLGQMTTVGKPSWYTMINTDVKLAKNTFLSVGFNYYGRNYYLMSIIEPSNNLTVGITQYMLDRRLQLSLFGNDLFRASNSDWRDRYEFYETSQHAIYDWRYVRLSVRWLFNNHKARYKVVGNSEEYNRIN